MASHGEEGSNELLEALQAVYQANNEAMAALEHAVAAVAVERAQARRALARATVAESEADRMRKGLQAENLRRLSRLRCSGGCMCPARVGVDTAGGAVVVTDCRRVVDCERRRVA